MPFTLPGNKVWENTAPAAVGNPAVLTNWIDTTGYTNVVLAYVFTNSTGTTTMTVEGSFDSVSQDATMAYAALAASPQTALVVPVMHTYIRFRIVQATAAATVTTVYAQARQ